MYCACAYVLESHKNVVFTLCTWKSLKKYEKFTKYRATYIGTLSDEQSVRQCLSKDVLTTEQVQKFCKWAKEYICVCHKYWQERQQQANAQTGMEDIPNEVDAATPVKIEKMVRQFKTHRCALDFDHGFCAALFAEMRWTEWWCCCCQSVLWFFVPIVGKLTELAQTHDLSAI